MLMAEYSLPRRLLRNQTQVIVGLTDTVIAGPNEKRLALIISTGLVARFTVNFGSQAILDQGFNVYPSTPPFEILEDRYGQAIREEVHAISSGQAQVVTVLDIFSP
jgi:hypothetical protein